MKTTGRGWFEWVFRIIYAMVLLKTSWLLCTRPHEWLSFPAVALLSFTMVARQRTPKLEYIALCASLVLLLSGTFFPSKALGSVIQAAGLGGLLGANLGAMYRHWVSKAPVEQRDVGTLCLYAVGIALGIWILIGGSILSVKLFGALFIAAAVAPLLAAKLGR